MIRSQPETSPRNTADTFGPIVSGQVGYPYDSTMTGVCSGPVILPNRLGKALRENDSRGYPLWAKPSAPIA